MRINNDFIIIGVDAGYGNMKTANTIFPTGLAAMDTKPYFDGDIMHYNGRWYRIGEGHKAFNPDKTADEDFYILTLASIAAELRTRDIAEANIYLAIGLPTTWTVRQRNAYREYMLRNKKVEFVFNDISYHLHFTQCSVFPQGYAAMVPMMDISASWVCDEWTGAHHFYTSTKAGASEWCALSLYPGTQRIRMMENHCNNHHFDAAKKG